MMHLIHRNRVDHFADFPRNISPLRSPFPRGEGLFRLSLSIRARKTDTIIAFTVTVNLTKRMRAPKASPEGTLAP